jgi:hypothetical protein
MNDLSITDERERISTSSKTPTVALDLGAITINSLFVFYIKCLVATIPFAIVAFILVAIIHG